MGASDIVKKARKRGSGEAWSYVEGVLGGYGSVSRIKQRKVHQKLANRHAVKLFWERLPHNLSFYQFKWVSALLSPDFILYSIGYRIRI